MKRAVMIGAGNIGRGFIGALLEQSGYHVLFADINEEMIRQLGERGHYTVHLLAKEIKTLQIKNIAAKLSTDPTMVDEIAKCDVVTTAVGVAVLPRIAPTIAKGVAARYAAKNNKPLHIIACENAIRGTTQLKAHVQEYLTEEERAFMNQHVGFLDCEVDCIVPPQNNEELTDVSVERDYEWAVETVNVKGELSIDGMTAVDKLEPFLERKLYTLNGAFVFSSHLGWIYGLEISNDAAAHPGVVGYTKKFMSECEELLVQDHPSFDHAEILEYNARSYARMINPYVVDSVFRHGRDPIRKLASDERIVAPLMKLKAHGMDYSAHATAVAAALAYDYPGDEQAMEVQRMIATDGVEITLHTLTGIGSDTEEGKRILAEYARIIALKQELARKKEEQR